VAIDHRLLDGCQFTAICDSLNCDNVRSIKLEHKSYARVDRTIAQLPARRPPYKDCTRPTVALGTNDFRADQS
jgi:hypothetical protein